MREKALHCHSRAARVRWDVDRLAGPERKNSSCFSHAWLAVWIDDCYGNTNRPIEIVIDMSLSSRSPAGRSHVNRADFFVVSRSRGAWVANRIERLFADYSPLMAYISLAPLQLVRTELDELVDCSVIIFLRDQNEVIMPPFEIRQSALILLTGMKKCKCLSSHRAIN